MSTSGRSLGTPTWEPFLCPTGAGQHCTTSLNWKRQNDRRQECSSAFIAFFLLPWRLWRGLGGGGGGATRPLPPPPAPAPLPTTPKGRPPRPDTHHRTPARSAPLPRIPPPPPP